MSDKPRLNFLEYVGILFLLYLAARITVGLYDVLYLLSKGEL